MADALTPQVLRSRFSEVRENLPRSLALRLHRSLSWIERADQEAEDVDAAFIFHWIAFNAAYAIELMMDHPDAGWGPPYYPVVD